MVHFNENIDRYELTFTNRPRVSEDVNLIIASEEDGNSVSVSFGSSRKAREFADAIYEMVEKYEAGPLQ